MAKKSVSIHETVEVNDKAETPRGLVTIRMLRTVWLDGKMYDGTLSFPKGAKILAELAGEYVEA